jgi:molybdenum cofactor cytidylyltransferase
VPADQTDRQNGGALILAAGFGRRFGSDKRRYRLPDGRPLLLATVSRYLASFPRICVVLRREDDDLAAEAVRLDPGIEIAVAERAHLGMGHSLAAGIHAVTGRWMWAAVALGDMPFVRNDTLDRLIAAFSSAPGEAILQPWHHERPGHPVFFAGAYFSELSRLTGDAGARTVLTAHPGSIVQVDVDDPGVLEDLDRPL